MKKLFSLALLTAAVAGISVAIMSIIKKRKDNEEDIIYSEDFDDYDEEENSYFDVHMSDDGINLQEEQEEEKQDINE